MADYCGEAWPRDGSPRAEVLGDFLEYFEETIEPRLEPGYLTPLGICEGHGTGVVVVCEDDGRVWLLHVELEGDPPRTDKPDPIEIPSGTQTPGRARSRPRILTGLP